MIKQPRKILAGNGTSSRPGRLFFFKAQGRQRDENVTRVVEAESEEGRHL